MTTGSLHMFWRYLHYQTAEKETAQPWFSVLLFTTLLLQITTCVNTNISERLPYRCGTTCPIIYSVQEMSLESERPYLCAVQQGLSYIWPPSIIRAIDLKATNKSLLQQHFLKCSYCLFVDEGLMSAVHIHTTTDASKYHPGRRRGHKARIRPQRSRASARRISINYLTK